MPAAPEAQTHTALVMTLLSLESLHGTRIIAATERILLASNNLLAGDYTICMVMSLNGVTTGIFPRIMLMLKKKAHVGQ